jgi:hypothetical protein
MKEFVIWCALAIASEVAWVFAWVTLWPGAELLALRLQAAKEKRE